MKKGINVWGISKLLTMEGKKVDTSNIELATRISEDLKDTFNGLYPDGKVPQNMGGLSVSQIAGSEDEVLNIFFLYDNGKQMVLANPEIINCSSKKRITRVGCYSAPNGERVLTWAPESMTISYYDIQTKEKKLYKCEYPVTGIACHELLHLKGKPYEMDKIAGTKSLTGEELKGLSDGEKNKKLAGNTFLGWNNQTVKNAFGYTSKSGKRTIISFSPETLKLKAKSEQLDKAVRSAFRKSRKRFQYIDMYSEIIRGVMEDIPDSKRIGNVTMCVYQNRTNTPNTEQRKMHSERVANLATKVGAKKGLDTNQLHTVAKYHDIKHPPYGHDLEWWISDIMQDMGIGWISHNAEAVRALKYKYKIESRIINEIKRRYPNMPKRMLMKIESEVWMYLYDGILCHNGEIRIEDGFEPNRKKNEMQSMEELRKCFTKKGFERTILPATREGCLIRPTDVLAYAATDFKDGMINGIITKEKALEEYTRIFMAFGMNENEICKAINTEDYMYIVDKIHQARRSRLR